MTRCSATGRHCLPAAGRETEAGIGELGGVDSDLPGVVLKMGEILVILPQSVKQQREHLRSCGASGASKVGSIY
jgi:hypothetical protein